MKRRHFPLMLFSGLIAACAIAADVSDPIMVTAVGEKSLLWNTITRTAETVQIPWPSSAASGLIEMSNGRRIELSDTSQTSVQVEFGTPADAASERLLDLSLTFFDSNGTVLDGETRSVQLGFVRGCGTGSFDLRPSDIASPMWAGMPAKGIVFLGGDVATFSTNGVAIAVDGLRQPWWFKPVFPDSKILNMALASSDGVQYERAVFGIVPGTVVIFK